MPRTALAAILAWFLLPTSLIFEALTLTGIYNGEGFRFVASNAIWVWLADCLIFIPWFYPLTLGRVYAIRIFRAEGFVMATFHTVLIGLALVLLQDHSQSVRNAFPGPRFVLVALLALIPLTVIWVRALLQVRWLDPRSRPDEWEPPTFAKPVWDFTK